MVKLTLSYFILTIGDDNNHNNFINFFDLPGSLFPPQLLLPERQGRQVGGCLGCSLPSFPTLHSCVADPGVWLMMILDWLLAESLGYCSQQFPGCFGHLPLALGLPGWGGMKLHYEFPATGIPLGIQDSFIYPK
jgi:hypothetical protein